MKTVYRPEPEGKCSMVLLSNPDLWLKMSSVNFDRMGESWAPMDFEFHVDEKRIKEEPDIAAVVPTIAIRKELAERVFFDELANFEFLPIFVSGQDWVLVNCLVNTKGMDLKNSLYYRDLSGVIFLMQKISVIESEVSSGLAFTIDGSNRSTVFVLEKFVRRIRELGLRGLTFKPVGELI